MPQISAMRRRIAGSGVNAFIGMRNRSRDIRRAESPDSVNTQTYLASTKSATSAAARVIAPPWVRGFVPSGGMRSRPWSSVDSMMRAIVCTVIDRVLADAGLAGEHDGVRAVEDRVGDVGGLGARRHRARDHRLEHLRRDDDRLRHAAGELDGVLLHDRHRLERKLDAEVAAGDHDRVERVDDRLEVVDRLRLLDLRDDRDAAPLLLHDLVHADDVVGVAHERQGDEVDAEARGPSAGPPRPSRTAPARSPRRRAG